MGRGSGRARRWWRGHGHEPKELGGPPAACSRETRSCPMRSHLRPQPPGTSCWSTLGGSVSGSGAGAADRARPLLSFYDIFTRSHRRAHPEDPETQRAQAPAGEEGGRGRAPLPPCLPTQNTPAPSTAALGHLPEGGDGQTSILAGARVSSGSEGAAAGRSAGGSGRTVPWLSGAGGRGGGGGGGSGRREWGVGPRHPSRWELCCGVRRVDGPPWSLAVSPGED